MSSLKNVVVVGLGPAGAAAVNGLSPILPSTHRIVAINEQPYAYHTVASLRGAVTPGWEKQISYALDKLLQDPRHVLVAGNKVTSISPSAVTLDKAHPELGSEIPYDFLVIATGSTYAFPARPPTEAQTIADVETALAKLQEDLSKAKSVLVIGGGAVGTEFAGEVKAQHPKVDVTLVHSHDRLHSSLFKPGLHDSLLKQLKTLGVKTILNSKVELGQHQKSGKIDSQAFKLDNGQTVEADFILIATGTTPNGHVLSTLDPALVDKQGQIAVKNTLQVDSANETYAHIFAIGDVIAGADMKLSYTAGLQAAHASKNIVALLKGQPLKPYTPAAIMGVVTLGPGGGACQIPLFGGLVLGGWMAKMVKSKTLFVPQTKATYYHT